MTGNVKKILNFTQTQQYIWSADTVDDMYTVAVAVLGGGCTVRTYVLQQAHILVSFVIMSAQARHYVFAGAVRASVRACVC